MKQNKAHYAKTSIYLFILSITISIALIEVSTIANATVTVLPTLGDYSKTTVQLGGNTMWYRLTLLKHIKL
jgi:hypothetical protein